MTEVALPRLKARRKRRKIKPPGPGDLFVLAWAAAAFVVGCVYKGVGHAPVACVVQFFVAAMAVRLGIRTWGRPWFARDVAEWYVLVAVSLAAGDLALLGV